MTNERNPKPFDFNEAMSDLFGWLADGCKGRPPIPECLTPPISSDEVNPCEGCPELEECADNFDVCNRPKRLCQIIDDLGIDEGVR